MLDCSKVCLIEVYSSINYSLLGELFRVVRELSKVSPNK